MIGSHAQSFGSNDLVFLSSVVLAELRYGMEAALRAGQAVDHFRETVEMALSDQRGMQGKGLVAGRYEPPIPRFAAITVPPVQLIT